MKLSTGVLIIALAASASAQQPSNPAEQPLPVKPGTITLKPSATKATPAKPAAAKTADPSKPTAASTTKPAAVPAKAAPAATASKTVPASTVKPATAATTKPVTAATTKPATATPKTAAPAVKPVVTATKPATPAPAAKSATNAQASGKALAPPEKKAALAPVKPALAPPAQKAAFAPKTDAKQAPSSQKPSTPAVAAATPAPEKEKEKVEKVASVDRSKRDPFQSVIVDRAPGTGCSGGGKQCLIPDEVALKGIVRSNGAILAVVTTKENRAYFLRENDSVLNGVVTRITEGSITFRESSTDIFGRHTTREVVKKITPAAV